MPKFSKIGNNMVVSFSGIDGSGKTTQITLLEEYCNKNKILYVKKWSKARGTPGVEFLKSLVRRDRHMTQSLKLEHREEIFRSGWKKGVLYFFSMVDLCWYWGIYYRILRRKYPLVILDRYLWDTFVEVSVEFDKPSLQKSLLWKIVKTVALKPNVSILLTIPAEESLRRDMLKGEITTEELSIKRQKIDIYLTLASQNCWSNIVDSTRSIDDTHKLILKALNYNN